MEGSIGLFEKEQGAGFFPYIRVIFFFESKINQT
jgi:hypothetical protein